MWAVLIASIYEVFPLLCPLCGGQMAQVRATLKRMAKVVDQQNAGDPAYQPMTGNETGAAFQAASDLVFKGLAQPSGYTEPLLHAWRSKVKAGA